MSKTPWKEIYVLCSLDILRVFNSTGTKFCDFRNFSPFSRKLLYSRKVSKPKSLKLNTREIEYPPSQRFSFS